MPKISPAQLLVWMFVARMFPFSLGSDSALRSQSGTVLWVPIFLALALVLWLPTLLCKSDVGVLQALSSHSAIWGRLLSFFCLLFSLTVLVDTLLRFLQFLWQVVYAAAAPGLYLLVFLGVALVIALFGIEGGARLAGFLAPCFVLFLLAVFFSLAPEYRLLPLETYSLANATPLESAIRALGNTPELLLLPLLGSQQGGKSPRGALWWLVLLGGVQILVSVLLLTSVGAFADLSGIPLYGAARAAKLVSFLRLDAIAMMLFVALGVLRATLWLQAAGVSLRYLFPQVLSKPWRLVLSGLLGLGLALLPIYYPQLLSTHSPGVLALLVAILTMLPSLLLLFTKRGEH